MKALPSSCRRLPPPFLLGGLLLLTGLRALPADADAAAPELPYEIPFETGASAFAAGDRIAITALRGDRPHLDPNGTYLVQGTYTLRSADQAELGFFCTSENVGQPTPIAAGQQVRVTPGTGTFALSIHAPGEGWLHVSFCVEGRRGMTHSRGGIYFGEQGVAQTILRRAAWLEAETAPAPRPAPGPGREGSPAPRPDPNQAILSYLIHPVPPPVDLDPKYSPAALKASFAEMAEKAGWRIKVLAVDDTEFPFLVYGVLRGRQDFGDIAAQLRSLPGYAYGGSVVGAGAHQSTYFALNMTPRDQFPPDQAEACNRRLMVRLQMLADAALRAGERP